MPAKKYPLDPLARVRELEVDDAARALGGAAAAREEAATRRALAARARAGAEAEARALADSERGALERGELRVADLMHGDAWQAKVRVEHAELARRADEATAREEAALAEEARARANVAAREADAQIVARDRARWTDAERRRDEAKEEEALTDPWRPRRS
jgi:dTMP kinase